MRAAAPTLVMAIGVFMILNRLAITMVIVNAAYMALTGALARGAGALARRTGARELAGPAAAFPPSRRRRALGGAT